MDAAYLAALLFLVHVPLVEGCGGTYTGSSGDIFSPSYPNDYGVSLTCTYNIVPSAPGSLQLVFVDFETEGPYDYVRVYNSSDVQIASLTGSRTGAVMQTSSSYKVVFTTDPWTVKRGFKATWAASPSSSVDPGYGLYTSCPFDIGFTLVNTTITKVKVLEQLLGVLSPRCRTLCILLTACTHYTHEDTGVCKLYKHDATASVDFENIWMKN
ncbi:deleted in malignant brain tumors 1 protein-like [Haliotis rufescens]|uniref:deleted in malignant brain tumors 1 protein-like n=1 Tax=Haliotis rufescens TaxID=6454 RepID=UPI00201E8EC9|nr:deleted in malignant brain tumors 1 protein-like [Haliotis rufescens]